MIHQPETLAEVPDGAVGDGGILSLVDWHEQHGLVAGITAAGDGDYGLYSPDPARVVVDRWLALPGRLGGGGRFESVVVSRQVHGTRIAQHEATRGWQILDGFDGHITATRGLLLAVSVADCVPVYLVAPDAGVVALVHAGWRGTAAGILEEAIKVVSLAAPGSRIDVHLGVGICGDCYEVGPEVFAALGLEPASGPAQLDLRSVLAKRAWAAGSPRLTQSPWCARHDARFHSFRRDGERSGRMVAFLGFPLA